MTQFGFGERALSKERCAHVQASRAKIHDKIVINKSDGERKLELNETLFMFFKQILNSGRHWL